MNLKLRNSPNSLHLVSILSQTRQGDSPFGLIQFPLTVGSLGVTPVNRRIIRLSQFSRGFLTHASEEKDDPTEEGPDEGPDEGSDEGPDEGPEEGPSSQSCPPASGGSNFIHK